jgi:hypothetical protein
MAAKAQAGWKPSISDEKVKAATGRGWMGWFVILNRIGATAMAHKDVARLLHEKYAAPGWWCQMITVEYERARGGRAKHERPDGYSVSITKVMPVGLSALFAAATDPRTRRAWFPPGAFAETSKTKDKYWRGTWKRDARFEAGFYAKGTGKAQIALQLSKLAGAEDVEKERTAWKRALAKLETVLADARSSRKRDHIWTGRRREL